MDILHSLILTMCYTMLCVLTDYATNSMFLSGFNSVVVVVIGLHNNIEDQLERWLGAVNEAGHRGGLTCRALVVGTHVDQATPQQVESFLAMRARFDKPLSGVFKHTEIVGWHAVDLMNSSSQQEVWSMLSVLYCIVLYCILLYSIVILSKH